MKRITDRNSNGKAIVLDDNKIEKAIERLADIEDTFGEEYDLSQIEDLIKAKKVIGKTIWGKAGRFHMFTKNSEDIVSTTIDYVLLMDNGIALRTLTCYVSINEIGKRVFFDYEEAKSVLKNDERL